jgi:phosphoribosylformylglycinamidine synthase
MIHFFGNPQRVVFAVQITESIQQNDIPKLTWLFGNQALLEGQAVNGNFIGPRAAMVSPWSTNAVEITQNMGIRGIRRIERYAPLTSDTAFDPMLNQQFEGLDQQLFTINIKPEPIRPINDIAAYNASEGLALSAEEVAYLEEVAQRIGRKLTDSEVFGFSQINSEHCRHKIFNGSFVIDGQEQTDSLFSLIKKTAKAHPNSIVSAYKDNVAFLKGPKLNQFAPERPDQPSSYRKKEVDTVVSLKAETHNFPTTVEPFNGAATGSWWRDPRPMAGGIGALPLAGTAVYMTAYSRLNENAPGKKPCLSASGFTKRPWIF